MLSLLFVTLHNNYISNIHTVFLCEGGIPFVVLSYMIINDYIKIPGWSQYHSALHASGFDLMNSIFVKDKRNEHK